jgi:peptidoglycan/xylan/chitin deacetylase (PgdA/CDA1 family)
MLAESRVKLHIPDGTLALTYDDGPGGHTIEIAKFLAELQIPATFFLIGQLLERHPTAARELVDLGHCVANHTFSHPKMPEVTDETTLVAEVLATERLIAKQVGDGPFLLRPPYGAWSPQVARALNGNGDTAKYIGPILWDIDERDWQIGRWRRRWIWTLKRCHNAYRSQIERQKKGIVLFHSCCGIGEESAKTMRADRKKFELTRLLVPRLKSEGFAFRRLDELLQPVYRPISRSILTQQSSKPGDFQLIPRPMPFR